MNTFDRRRVVVASVLTLVALPALWVFSRNSAASGSPSLGAAGISINAPVQTEPPTTAYQPSPPLFVGGDSIPNAPGVINIAVPPAPGPNEVLARATYHRYLGLVGTACTTAVAPEGAMLTITNLNNGQRITCLNTAGVAIPGGADVIIDTALYVQIGDLADAPLPVRVSW